MSIDFVIAGYGFVGQAHYEVLKNYSNVAIHDPALGHEADLSAAHAVIICVSTPESSTGECYMDNVYDVVSKCKDVPILIKSTISIEGWRTLKTRFPNHRFTFCPEFLRAATAVEDFKNTKQLLLGGDNVKFWSNVLTSALDHDVTTLVFDPEELILIKYFRNSFLATKVAFFNQIYDLCQQLDLNYQNVAKGVGIDTRIGDSHTAVTAERGFGGHCFPKDTSAIIRTAELFDVDLGIIRAAVNYNKRIRS